MYVRKYTKLQVGENSVKKAKLKYLQEQKGAGRLAFYTRIDRLKGLRRLYVYGSIYNTHLSYNMQ